MNWIKPMLASPLPANLSLTGWVAEEKYDGHRICVQLFDDGRVSAMSRNELPRILPQHITHELLKFPVGIYDGELISRGKQKSYGVTDLSQTEQLEFVIFDLLEVVGTDVKAQPYSYRRDLLETTFNAIRVERGVSLSESWRINDTEDVVKLSKTVWDRGGEGLILKDPTAPYTPGKRSKSWVKIKQCHTAVLTVVGYVAGRLGPHATVLLEDSEGFQTTVKTLNDRERARLEGNPGKYVGRKLRIEYQERTPDGGYRHPMWDRWEDA